MLKDVTKLQTSFRQISQTILSIKEMIKTSEIRYKTYKNKLTGTSTSILRYCEKQYYSDLLKAKKNNMKETWKSINDLLSIGNGGSGAVSTNGSTSLDPPHPPGRVWSISTPK